MKFEYDTKKSLSNKQKHDIDFEEAKLLWNDDKCLKSGHLMKMKIDLSTLEKLLQKCMQ